ncbi:hypothetical protein [Micrococcus lacusdianchii]|uniref:hypothetical protein n=1 Tax=Micrococcus lacusdianchii TaxID=2915940 RepID=UPI0020049C94|nr:hypothetical protein [Micrococcus sp. JXJ CY 30]
MLLSQTLALVEDRLAQLHDLLARRRIHCWPDEGVVDQAAGVPRVGLQPSAHLF